MTWHGLEESDLTRHGMGWGIAGNTITEGRRNSPWRAVLDAGRERGIENNHTYVRERKGGGARGVNMAAKKATTVSPQIRAKARAVLAFAEEQAAEAADWVELSNA